VDIQFQAVAVEWVVARIEEVRPEGVNIFILDACRNAPFRSLWHSAYSGFTTLQGGQGSLIAYATAPEKVADEGEGQRNGLYTKHLLRFITEPHLSIERLFKQVRLAVEQESRAKTPKNPQIPWESSSLREKFYFNSQPRPSTGPIILLAVQSPPPPPQTLAATIVSNDRSEMVLIPAGAFLMGTHADEIDRLRREWPHIQGEFFDRETPQHRLSLKAFYIDKYEVTNTRFQQFVQATGYRTLAEREDWGWVHTKEWVKVKGASWWAPHGPGSNISGLEQHPVVQVSWEDAKAYCAWTDKRLPTEAEWEKAARGPDGYNYPWGNAFDGERGNFCDRNCDLPWKDGTADDGYRYTAPVGSYEKGKSPYGVYDMAGNVWEWVADWFDTTYYRRGTARNLQGPVSGDMAIIRGGSWLNNRLLVRVVHRGHEIPTSRFSNTGLRCAKSL
jgi:sulfatase modifying factor 1